MALTSAPVQNAPLRLVVTAGWNLTESVGLPVAAYAIAAWLAGKPGTIAS